MAAGQGACDWNTLAHMHHFDRTYHIDPAATNTQAAISQAAIIVRQNKLDFPAGPPCSLYLAGVSTGCTCQNVFLLSFCSYA